MAVAFSIYNRTIHKFWKSNLNLHAPKKATVSHDVIKCIQSKIKPTNFHMIAKCELQIANCKSLREIKYSTVFHFELTEIFSSHEFFSLFDFRWFDGIALWVFHNDTDSGKSSVFITNFPVFSLHLKMRKYLYRFSYHRILPNTEWYKINQKHNYVTSVFRKIFQILPQLKSISLGSRYGALYTVSGIQFQQNAKQERRNWKKIYGKTFEQRDKLSILLCKLCAEQSTYTIRSDATSPLSKS